MYEALSFSLVVTEIVGWIVDRTKGDAFATETWDDIEGAIELIQFTGIVLVFEDFPVLMPDEVVGVIL